MSRTQRSLKGVAGICVLLVCSLASVRARAAGGDDPLNPPRPRTRPAFRSLLSPDEYKQRAAPFADRIAALRENPPQNGPAFGRKVVGVFPDGWAAKNDVQVGDVVTELGGERLWADGFPTVTLPAPVQVYTAAADRMRTLRLDSELFGAQFSVCWQPEHLYFKSSRRNARWDEEALLGILARGSDPDLAESAWEKALDAGYREDALSDQCGGEIALCQNRPEVAAEFAAFIRWKGKNDSEDVNPLLLYRVAMANFHWERAKEIVMAGRGQLGSLHPVAAVRLIEMHRARPESERTLAPPSQRLKDLVRIDLTDRLLGSNSQIIEHRQSDLRAGKPIQMTSPTAHFSTITIETPEPTPNLEFSIRCSGRPTDNSLDRYTKWFVVTVSALVPPDAESADPYFDPQFMRFAVNAWGEVLAGCGGTYSEAFFTDPTVQSLDNREHEFRLLRFGGQIELFLNGHRIVYGPCPEGPYPVQFGITATGTTMDIHSLSLGEYVRPL